MPADSLQPQSIINTEATGSQVASPALSDLATISHQKGDVRMITLTSDKIDMLLSATGSISSNFLTLMIGIAAAVFYGAQIRRNRRIMAGYILACFLVLINPGRVLWNPDSDAGSKEVSTQTGIQRQEDYITRSSKPIVEEAAGSHGRLHLKVSFDS